MDDEKNIAIRHAGLIVLQRLAYVGGSFVFAIIVPRVLGPSFYGQFSLIGAISAWFAFLGAAGLGQVVGRYVPLFVLKRDVEGLHEFLGQLMAARFAGCFAGMGFFYIFFRVFLPDINALILIPASGALFMSALSDLIYSFFWGLNRAAWWGMGELIRRAAQIVLIVPGFLGLGLLGAFWGMFGVELLVLTFGIWRVRPFLDRWRLWPSIRYLGSYARFGLLFSLNDLLLTLFQRSGEMLVRLYTSSYAAVGQFALSYSLYMTIVPAMSQLVLACLPVWTSLEKEEKFHELQLWIDRLTVLLTSASILAILGALLLGERLLPLILGSSFRPVTDHLVLLLLALPVVPLTSVAGAIALMQNRPGLALQTSAALLLGYWTIASIAIPRWGSLGACGSLLVSMILYAAFFVWRIRTSVAIPLRQWARVVVIGIVFILLAGGLPAAYRGFLAFLIFAAGFIVCIFAARILQVGDAAAVWRAFRDGRAGCSLPLSNRTPEWTELGEQ